MSSDARIRLAAFILNAVDDVDITAYFEEVLICCHFPIWHEYLTHSTEIQSRMGSDVQLVP
jgi:hypothetical protein